MRILVVTGRLASEGVKTAVKASGVPADVYVADCDVASLMPWSEVLKALEYARSHGYDVVVVPGTLPVSADELKRVSSEYGVTVVKGPRELTSLPKALQRIAEKPPAPGEVVEGALGPEDLLSVVESLEYECLESSCGLCIPLRPPPIHVWFEVFGWDEPGRAARKVLEEPRPAHAVVLGVGGGADRDETLRALRKLLDHLQCVGLDAPSPRLLIEAAKAGACIVMSVHPGLSGLLDELPKGTVVVLTPAPPGQASAMPLRGRVEALKSLASRAQSKGLVAVADPILEPPLMGLARSLEAYALASRLLNAPLLAGVGNVYELLDSDSHGVVGLLVPLLAELGASVMLASEESRKARGTLIEVAAASAMASAAIALRSPPKDLGLDLLVTKEKRAKKASVPHAAAVVEAWNAPKQKFERDPVGDLLIDVDEDEGVILVTLVRGGRPQLTLKARSAEEAYRAAIALGMVSRLDHAAYLGKELCKAELSLALGVSYVQDKPLLADIKRRWGTLAKKYVELTLRPRRLRPRAC